MTAPNTTVTLAREIARLRQIWTWAAYIASPKATVEGKPASITYIHAREDVE